MHSSATEVPSKAKSKAASPVQRKPHSSKVANRPKAPTKEPWHQAGPTKVTQPRAKATMMPKHKAAKVPQTPIRKHKVVHSTPKPKASLLANPKAPLLATPKAFQQATPKATSKAPLLATSKASLATPKAMPAPETPRRSLRPSVQTPRYDAHLAAHLTPRRGGLEFKTPKTRSSINKIEETPKSVKKVEEKQEEAEESMMEGEAACGKTHMMVACGKCPGDYTISRISSHSSSDTPSRVVDV